MGSGKNLVLIFDMPRGSKALQMRVLRSLHKMKAKKLQHSVWQHKDLNELIDLASHIKNNGGDARILEERFVF